MARYTERLGLQIPELDDMYDISVYAGLLGELDRSMVVGTGIGAIYVLTEEEYAALPEHNPATLYAVKGENSFRLMLGELGLQGGGGFPSITDDFHRVEEHMLTGTVTSSFAFAKDGYDYWNQSSEQNRNNVSVSVSTSDSKGTLLAVCMSRSTATIDGDGWTKIAESVHCSSSGVEQWITVWRKDINSACSGTVMARQTDVSPMRICVFAFYGFDIRFDVVGNAVIESFPYTPITKTGKRRLYLGSIIRSGYQEGIWTDASLVKLASTQFSVFLDYNAGGTDTPVLTTPETGYQAGAAVCLTLDITVDGT